MAARALRPDFGARARRGWSVINWELLTTVASAYYQKAQRGSGDLDAVLSHFNEFSDPNEFFMTLATRAQSRHFLLLSKIANWSGAKEIAASLQNRAHAKTDHSTPHVQNQALVFPWSRFRTKAINRGHR
jgi:hypothetical protein